MGCKWLGRLGEFSFNCCDPRNPGVGISEWRGRKWGWAGKLWGWGGDAALSVFRFVDCGLRG